MRQWRRGPASPAQSIYGNRAAAPVEEPTETKADTEETKPAEVQGMGGGGVESQAFLAMEYVSRSILFF